MRPPQVQLTDVTLTIIRPLKKTDHAEVIYPTEADSTPAYRDSYLPLILAYRLSGNSKQEFSHFVNRLKESLEKVLVPFFAFAGRWIPHDKYVRQLLCKDQGVPFIEASVDDRVDSVIRPSDKFHTVLGLNGFETLGMDSSKWPQKMLSDGWPPIFFQVTRFKCGSAVLGVTFNHMHTDAESLQNFMESWSEVARTNTITIQPNFDRTLVAKALSETIGEEPEANGEAPADSHGGESPSDLFTKLNQSTAADPFWVTKVYEVKISSIESMKREAKRNGSGPFISTSDCIVAHMWKNLFNVHKILNDPRYFCVSTMVEGRKRFYKRPLPHLCANVVTMLVCPQTPDEELLETPSHVLAQNLKAKLLGLKPEDWFSSERVEEIMQAVAPSSSHFVNNSWIRFPMYELDFGVGGKPYFAPSPNIPIDILRENFVCSGLNFIMPPIPGHSSSASTLFFSSSDKVVNALESSREFMSLFL